MAEIETPPRTYYGTNGADRYSSAKDTIEKTQGSIWEDRAWWRLAACTMIPVLLGLMIYVIVTRHPKMDILYITRNDEGQTRIANWDEHQVSEDEIKKDLAIWLRCVRGIPNHQGTLERCWRLVPMFVLKESHAWKTVVKHFAEIAPGKRLFEKSIEVSSIKAFLEMDGRWRMTWTEEVYDLPKGGGLGKLRESGQKSAVLVVTRVKPRTREQVLLDGEVINPNGLYLTHLAWETE